MQNIITFTQLENYAKSLELTDPIEIAIRQEILAYIEMQKVEFNQNDLKTDLPWQTPNELIFNILDEAHDGAYNDDGQDPEWDDWNFEEFCITYGIIPLNWDTDRDQPYLGEDKRYAKEQPLSFERAEELIYTCWVTESTHECLKLPYSETQRVREEYMKRLKRLDDIFKDLIQWSQYDYDYWYAYLHNHYAYDPAEFEKLWKKTSIHPDFKPEYRI